MFDGGEVAATSASDGVLEERLGVRLSDRDLFRQALTHRSHAFEAGGEPTNERLEFLGDSVLGLIVTDMIYRRFPDAPEGRMAKVRSAAVNTHSLADVARRLEVGDHVLLGRGEEQSGGRNKDSILADTFEALLGAVYLDQGPDVAREVVHRLFDAMLDEIATRRASLDYKTSLQELSAAQFAVLPVYELTEAGPDHAKHFTAVVLVNDERLGEGEGRSKKEAEQAAAERAYTVLKERTTILSSPTDAER